MAWYNDGDWSGVPLRLGGTLLGQLRYAITERAYWASEGGAPSLLDWTGDRIVSLASDIESCHSLIEALCDSDKFYDPVANVPYTLATALDAAGYESWIAPIEGRVAATTAAWDQIKDVLAVLVYCVRTAYWTAQGKVKYDSSNVSQQDAWDNARGDTESDSVASDVGWSLGIDGSTGWVYEIGTRVVFSTEAGNTITDATITAEERAMDEGGNQPDTLVVTGAAADLTLDLTGTHPGIATRSRTIQVPNTFWSGSAFEMTWSVPGTRPAPTVPKTLGHGAVRYLRIPTSGTATGIRHLIVGTDLTYG
jgi:hypothetical protein